MRCCLQNLVDIGNNFGNANRTNVVQITNQQLYDEGPQGQWIEAFRGKVFSFPILLI